MKDLLEFLWTSLARYVPLLVGMVTAPKTTIMAVVERKDRFEIALTFAAVTIVIGFLLQAPLAAGTAELSTVAGSMIALKLLSILLGAAAIVVSFRLVGGAVAFDATLCGYMLMVGPLYLLGILLITMMGGVLAGHDPEAARLFLRNGVIADEVIAAMISDSVGAAALLALLAVVMIASLFVWPVICWGAFRAINGVSRLRSTLAYGVALILFLFVLTPVFDLVMRGLHSGDLPPIK